MTITTTLTLGLLVGWLAGEASAESFKQRQMKFPRVQAARREKEAVIKKLFEQQRLPFPPRDLFFRVFKQERALEVWARPAEGDRLQLVKAYPICAVSGALGPKRREGDGQIPEGFYVISGFNPASRFHLSLRVSYPNASDRVLGGGRRLGGDIFIHGDCVTIGCVPITDDGIKEVYLMAVEATSAGQATIPVHIFPTRLDDRGLRQLEKDFAAQPRLLDFWRDLKPGFDAFETRHQVPRIRIQRSGRYRIL